MRASTIVSSSWSSTAVVECNEEQIQLFAHEIASRLHVRVIPIMLDQLERPDRRTARLLARADYFATTDYHFKQVKEIAAQRRKKILQLRLNAAFLTELIAAARRGRVLMIVSNIDFFAAFRSNLKHLGITPATLDRITAVDGNNIPQIRLALAHARYVYLSPICDPRLRQLIRARVKDVQ